MALTKSKRKKIRRVFRTLGLIALNIFTIGGYKRRLQDKLSQQGRGGDAAAKLIDMADEIARQELTK